MMLDKGRDGDREAGLTLVELLVVVVVLGVLAGIVVFGVGRFRSDTDAAACRADVSAVTAAAEAYTAVTGDRPREISDLTVGQYLMSAPSSGSYSFDGATGAVTRSPACPGGAGTAGTALPTPTTPPTTGLTTGPAASFPAAAGSCSGRVSIDNSWPQGYQAAVTVTNTGTAALTNWVAAWVVPAGVRLNNGWNATIIQSGDAMRAEAPSWSTTLAPGDSWTIGFIAEGPAAPPPSRVSLAGVGCGV
jgi:prepilin-type N-terminal cleavage/methylation domain-containing protein